MKHFISLFLALALCACASRDASLVLAKQVHNNQQLSFTPHHGEGRWGKYLTMNINYAPINQLFNQLSPQRPKPLKNRGEAHITVITPVEFYQVLGKKLSIEQISQIARDHHIQSATFEVVCLGRGQATVENVLEETFFVVVNSKDLVNIRRKIQALYIEQGGAAEDFNPNHFFPHITLGFSARDLHENDGVIKNSASCYRQLQLL